MSNLFPVFDIPAIIEENKMTDRMQKSSIYFDFEKGDFLLDNAGRIKTAIPYDTWVQWCLKTVYTQRWAYMGYSDQIGVELEEAFNQDEKSAQESYIERTITEALLADPYGRTKRVYDFIFEWQTDGVKVTFTISGIWDNDTKLTADLLQRIR